jgi:hypothetical protein
MTPFDCYKTYLALKNHFTKEKYNYHKYCGKSRASLQSFYKRKDRFWFEKLSRNKNDKEILEFFVSNFVAIDNPDSLWIGEIIRNGEKVYADWKKRSQSLMYTFKEEIERVFLNKDFDELFAVSDHGHPQILKEFIRGNLSIDTFVILDKILNFRVKFDRKINDPVWSLISLKMKKYSDFLNINIFRYKESLKEILIGEPR